jgi:monoamine oxidase
MDADVLVLGAGVAGLAAAQRLSAQGMRVVVLEARDRVGGRIHTLRGEGWDHPVELGAEFLHGTPRKLLSLGDRLALAPRKADGAHWIFRRGKVERADDSYEAAMELVGKMSEREETPAKFLARHHLTKTRRGQLVKEFVEGFFVADEQRVSTHFLAEESEAAEQVSGDVIHRPTRGYDALPNRLAKELDVRLSTSVSRVGWKRGRVEVIAHDALGKRLKLQATKVVVALPLGVLKAQTVRFDPWPRGFRSACQRLENGPIVKVAVRFREPFWERARAKDFTFMHSPHAAVPVWWRPKPFDSTVLVGWAAGPVAEPLIGREPRAVLGKALRSLEQAFGAKDLKVDAYRVVDWASDPYARGGYLVVPVGRGEDPEAISRPVERTLYFAGEHTQLEGHAGTVHGALWTGQRAADEVLAER